MKWTTPEYTEILSEAYPQYQEADQDDQDDIVQEVWHSIKEVDEENSIKTPPGLTKVIFSELSSQGQ